MSMTPPDPAVSFNWTYMGVKIPNKIANSYCIPISVPFSVFKDEISRTEILQF